MTDFVHLHVHTDFSLLDGAASAIQLADKARKLGQKHLAITDHGNMFGVLRFRDACLFDKKHELLPPEQQVSPIIGCEFYMSSGSRLEKTSAKNIKDDDKDDVSEYSDGKPFHLVLLATNEEGYKNLCTLSSLAYTEGFYYKPRIDEELLLKYHNGLICLSACIAGEIPRLILKGHLEEAQKRALWFNDVFGKDNFYLEIQDHGIQDQKKTNPFIIDIAKKTGIGLVATNDVHYLNQADSIAHDILLCIGTQKKRDDTNRMKFFGDQFYLKSGDEMAALFPEYPEAISNTVKIAQRCKCEIPSVKTSELAQYLPDCDIPKEYDNASDYLRALTMEGLAKRYPNFGSEIKERAEFELSIIINMGFTGYFLIVSDFINWAREHRVPVGPGRGSGAGSIVAYSLRITDIDPIKYKLIFERFLNPERISMPDFDIDFCEKRRGEVIEYVKEKYGIGRVAQIVTIGTIKAKNAIKDVARVLGFTIDESNVISKLIPDGPKTNLESAFNDEPKLREMEEDPKYKELFEIARKLEGKNRQPGIHASGVVIGKTDLINYLPLYRDKNGAIATQYTMDQIEACGLVKMDFLGLSTLTLIRNTEDIIKHRGGEFASFCIDNIPEDDAATFKLFSEGKTSGAFQFESDGMQNILKQAKPNTIEDLIALNALYRPGPMDNIPQFIRSKNGEQKISYPDPSLEDILKDTYGVIVYQEQVMQVAQRIAGYSLGGADLLRRAMGKKKMDVMKQEKEKFVAGALKLKFSEKLANSIFDLLIPFAGYGFNKSHAAAYSVLAYQIIYLKAHFPVEFMAAKLSNEINSPDKLVLYIDEARRMGLPIEPPDINKSDKYFTVVDGKIVYGLLGIKGVGEWPSRAIIAGRQTSPYKDFLDFLLHIDLRVTGKKVIELLISTGACDSFGVKRSVLLGNLLRAAEYTQKIKDDKKSAQTSLFADSGEAEYSSFEFFDFPEYSQNEKLKTEKELLGFYFSGHPMDEYKSLWEKYSQIDLRNTENIIRGRDYYVCGIIKSVRSMQIKNGSNAGKQMGSAVLYDYNGEIELTFFTERWEKYKNIIEVDSVFVIKGRFDVRNDKPALSAWEAYSVHDLDNIDSTKIIEEPQNNSLLEPYKEVWKRAVTIDLSNTEQAENGKEYLLVGIITTLKPYQITKGRNKDKWMCFASLSDYKGTIDVIIFNDKWDIVKDKLAVDTVAAIRGTVGERENKKGIILSEVLDPAKLETLCWKELHIRLKTENVKKEEDIIPIRDCIIEHSGTCHVFIHVPVNNKEVIVRTTTHIAAEATHKHIDELKHFSPVAEVWRV